MGFVALADNLIDSGSVLTPGVATILRDNIDALYEDTHAFAYKTIDETVNNSDVLQDDDDLHFVVGANEVWHVRYCLSYDTTAAANFQFQVTVPSGAGRVNCLYETSGFILGCEVETGSPHSHDVAAESDSVLRLDAFLVIGSTPGTVQLEWAQHTARNSDTNVNTGSFLVAHRLDDVSGVSYSEIADADVDDKSPGKEALATKFRDNPIGLYEEARADAEKSAEEIVNDSTELQIDDHLAFAVGANEEWHFTLALFVETTDAADLKLLFRAPAAATGYVYGYFAIGPGVFGLVRDFTAALGASASIDYTIGGAVSSVPIFIQGYIRTGANAGTLELLWAQDTAVVVDTKLQENSWLVAHRLDAISAGLGASYSAIANSELEPEADVIEALFSKLQGNPVALYNDTRAFAYKSDPEEVVSSTALQDDDDLEFAIGANETWHFSLVLHVSTAAAPDFKLQITTPDGGDTGYVYVLFEKEAGVDVSGALAAINSPISCIYTGTDASSVVMVDGFVITSGTAGDVNLQWAQNTSNAFPATVLAGSYLVARRLDDI